MKRMIGTAVLFILLILTVIGLAKVDSFSNDSHTLSNSSASTVR